MKYVHVLSGWRKRKHGCGEARGRLPAHHPRRDGKQVAGGQESEVMAEDTDFRL